MRLGNEESKPQEKPISQEPPRRECKRLKGENDTHELPMEQERLREQLVLRASWPPAQNAKLAETQTRSAIK
jgi:hypothetical protein